MKRKRVICRLCKNRVIEETLEQHASSPVCERNQKILERLSSKSMEPFASIARDFSLTREAVRLMAQQHGLGTGRARISERRVRYDEHPIGKKILARLSSEPLEGFATVARDFGLSRETVRLLAQRHGLGTGRERRAKRHVDVDPGRWNRFFPYIPELARFGVRVEIRPEHSVETANLNGKLCAFKSVFRAPKGYWDSSRLRAPVEFVLCRLSEGNWLVVPARKKNKKTTTGLEPATRRSGRGNANDDWRKFLNAWNLLKTEDSAQPSRQGATGITDPD